MKMKFIYLLIVVIIVASCNEKKQPYSCFEFKKVYRTITSTTDDTLLLIRKLNSIIEKEFCIDAYIMRGDLFVDLNKLDAARFDFRNALLVQKDNVYVLYQLGVIDFLENKYDSSIFFFRKAMDIKTEGNVTFDFNPNGYIGRYDISSSELLYRIGLSFYYSRQLNKAIESFNFCINHEYKLAECYAYRGAAYLESKNKNQACKDFNMAKNLGNKDAEGYSGLYCK